MTDMWQSKFLVYPSLHKGQIINNYYFKSKQKDAQPVELTGCEVLVFSLGPVLSGNSPIIVIEQTAKTTLAVNWTFCFALMRINGQNDLAIQALMTALVMVVVQILFDDTTQLAVVKDNQVVEKLFAYTAVKPLQM